MLNIAANVVTSAGLFSNCNKTSDDMIEIWKKGLEGYSVETYPTTERGSLECTRKINALYNYRRKIRTDKLNPANREKWEIIRKVSLLRLNEYSYAIHKKVV